MFINTINDIEVRLQENQDLSWLQKHGKAFCVFDETGSGCIGIGMKKHGQRYFVKVAGLHTIAGEVSPNIAVKNLIESISVYKNLQHPSLIKLLEQYSYKRYYVMVFAWGEGECLFDHWNFDSYKQNPSLQSPAIRFKALPIEKRLAAVETLFSFLIMAASKDYIAVDFYDGSIMYDFKTDILTICDIDLFKKKPVVNMIGKEYWGSKRVKAPEEYILHASMEECTNVFTLAAIIFPFFGTYTAKEKEICYQEQTVLPCSLDTWQLDKESYEVLKKALERDKKDRYASIQEFHQAWINALR